MTALPIALRGEAVAALVVGGGPVATRKALALESAGANVRVVTLSATPELEQRSERGSILLERRSYDESDMDDAQLVFAATGSREVNARVAADSIAAHRLVNVADVSAAGNFETMAVHRAGALTIAVAAGGVPGAASRVRNAIASRFDERYATAVEDLRALRARVLARDGTDAWRAVAARVLGDDFCAVVERGELKERLAEWR